MRLYALSNYDRLMRRKARLEKVGTALAVVTMFGLIYALLILGAAFQGGV